MSRAEIPSPSATTALLSSERMFRAFATQTTDGLSVADVHGNYTYVNPAFCEMVGYTEAELLQMTVFDVTSDKQDKATFSTSKGHGEGLPLLVVLQRKDGGDFLAEVLGNNIELDGKPLVLGVIRDVTDRERQREERRTLERQLLQMQKLKSLGVLAGGIAHDFNNLLTAILGNIELAVEDLPADSAVISNLLESQAAGHRAAELANQMLAYSGRGQFVIQPIDVQELVTGIAQLLHASIARTIHLTFNLGPTPAGLVGDVTQVRQVVMNLITNAAEAIGDQLGEIRVTTGSMQCSRQYLDTVSATLQAGYDTPLTEGLYAFVEVHDTGCGMSAETMHNVFDPFFTTKFTGRGLGMSAVLGILRGHRGAIVVDSEVGVGSTFRVLFPVARVDVAPQALPVITSTAVKPGWRGSGTVLLAEDEPAVREIGRQMLERLGFDVLSAVDGQHALSLYRNRADEITCVLLDLTMPIMDGDEAFRLIREFSPNAKIVLCSGFDEQAVTQHFAGRSLDGFIHKPYRMSALIAVLSRVLN